ncbi:hypothetical protein B1757_13720 [Acidithiobacillus marinus]|uniref:Uncharacterized protein n=1 Tax=Acidithiobacillus marinus TaxID=187490 RepID=A0A2I1DIF5_9PROT|nr:hypothetical protein [Acidithiobacillus marinus]PKY09656.1 hypothetical protein B1757_13720 [Acidithiobacillus marinus]
MVLYDMKAFYRFLEQATVDELQKKQASLNKVIPGFSDDVAAEAMVLLKMVEREILARLSVADD